LIGCSMSGFQTGRGVAPRGWVQQSRSPATALPMGAVDLQGEQVVAPHAHAPGAVELATMPPSSSKVA
jgi:hypothetical protein